MDRKAFFDALRAHLNDPAGSDRSTVVVVCDIRQFQLINGRFGYEAGNRLLDAVGDRIRDVLREQDLLGHLGGDEYALLLPGLPDPGIARLAINKIDQAMEAPFPVADDAVYMRLTYGLAWFDDPGGSADELLNRAEVALGIARHRGSHDVVYDQEVHTQVVTTTALVTELRRALDAQQLELYFQPKVGLRDGRTLSVESLARWNHPQRGLIAPGGFMDCLEHSPLIAPFTEWTLNVALRQCAAWQRSYPGISVAVNLSANILYDPALLEWIRSALSIWGLSADHLVAEVTESAMMREPGKSLETLRELHRLGVTVSIDDFGTGYSSLAYLKRLPVEELKIDKSFIMHMLDNLEDQQIVQSVIDLAHNLQIDVIAEGVESAQAANRLAAMGCDTGQGFFFAKPMRADELQQWLAQSDWGYRHATDKQQPLRFTTFD